MLSTRFVTGSLTWTDVGTPDIEAANAFYSGVLGWTPRSAGEEFGGYVTYLSEGQAVAGGMAVAESEAAPAWSLYFCTPDAHATAKAVQQAGGTVVIEPMDLGGLGHMAACTDPSGAAFCIWQAGTMQGFDAVDRPGTVCWAELYTGDVPATTAFYGEVFGLRTFEVPFPGGRYVTVYPADTTEDAMFGGVVPKDSDPLEASGESHWLPYFEVADCDAAVDAVRRLGGTVRLEPTDLEGVGRVAKLADPFGARFALMTPAPREG